MIVFVLTVLLASSQYVTSQSWNNSDGILPWESYIQISNIQRPLGLTLDQSSLAHHHFAIGYFCFHSFMYDEAQEAFNLAINTNPTFVEAYIGKMLACKHVLWSDTDFTCYIGVYNNISTMLDTYNITLTDFQLSLMTAVYQWYADQSSISAGEHAFLASIANLSAAYPNENDIRVLWGLSLLNVAYGSEYNGQMEPEPMIQARDKLIAALATEPNHPGALNYLIRAYDVAQVNIAQKALNYVSTYQNLVTTLSYAQHLPAQIWIRTGGMVLAKQADDTSIQVSLTLCLIKQLGYNTSVSSSELGPALARFNTTTDVSSFLLCDVRNRAMSTEWLSIARLQTGNWLGTVSSVGDLYNAYNRSNSASIIYLSSAYRTRARGIINIFYWLPYDTQFINKAQEISNLDDVIPFVALGNNITQWDLAWSEAGYRFSDCLLLLIRNDTNYNDPNIKSVVDEHLARFAVLSDQTISINNYVSVQLSMMISQIRGIIYYKNNSFQECLNILNDATQREFQLVNDNNSPTLLFARSSELLAMHLLLINRYYLEPTEGTVATTYMLNGTQVAVSQFPRRALSLYQIANSSAPGRAINLLGIARSNSQLRLNSEAVRVYRLLVDQITSTNTSDPIFSQEAIDFIAQNEALVNSAKNNQFYTSSIFIVFITFILH